MVIHADWSSFRDTQTMPLLGIHHKTVHCSVACLRFTGVRSFANPLSSPILK